MSEKYLPLFRKYRPQSFKDVVGQENLIKALSNAIELNKIANAYLFAGPRGTGKTSTARIFAKSLNCVNGPTLEPCQKCPSCLDITNASGLDVIEIDAATNRGIDDAKELIAQVQYAPMNGKYKIFIIDEVHMLSNEAFNALLKTFEEPPANVIFILATTEPHKVIETIVSRCQRFDLRRITTEDIVKRLREVSDLENIKITNDALNAIARNVSGGLRDSLALLDQVSILGTKEEIQKEDIENLLGKLTFDVSFNFLNRVMEKNINETLLCLENIYNKGLEPKNFCENFIEFLRNLIFILESDDENSAIKFTNFNKVDIEAIKSQNLDKTKVFRILDKVLEFYKEIRFTTNPYLWAELMVINLCKEEALTPVLESKSQPVQTFASIQSQPVAKAEPPAQNEIHSLQNETPKKMAPEIKKPEPLVVEEKISMVSETLKEIAIPDVPTEPPFAKGALNNETMESKEETKKPLDEPPKTFAVSDLNINPSEIWGNILNIIESIPAKFFYSGVGKLVGIEGNRLVIGFVNENAISQAKSDTKFKHLEKAAKSVLGDEYYPDFILITSETKVIDVKINAQTQTPKRNSYIPAPENEPSFEAKPPASKPLNDSFKKNMPSIPNVPTEAIKDFEESNEDKLNNSVYGAKTKEMLKEFNGRVIE